MKHISSIKPTVEKGLYGLVKRPDAKTPDLSELSKTIKKFQDTPDDHFTSRLRKRVPSNSSFKLESKDDFGLSKRFKSGSLTKIETPDKSATIVDSRFSDKSKPFQISKGITGLNKQFEKVLPKTDYSYTDPQYYEYKLKGQTIKDQQLSAFKNQNENDVDKLSIQGKYKKWREEELEKKANAIQKLYRGSSVRRNLAEGMKHIDREPVVEDEDGFEQVDFEKPIKKIQDVIEVGKAKRKEKAEDNFFNKKANKIQKLFRGKQARKDVNHFKEDIEHQKIYKEHLKRDEKYKRLQDTIDYAYDSQRNNAYKRATHKREKDYLKEIDEEKKFHKGISRLQAKVKGKTQRDHYKQQIQPHLEEHRKENPEQYKLTEYDTVKLARLKERQKAKDEQKAQRKKQEQQYEDEIQKIMDERQAQRDYEPLSERKKERFKNSLEKAYPKPPLAREKFKNELNERLQQRQERNEMAGEDKPNKPDKPKSNKQTIKDAWANKQVEINKTTNEEKQEEKEYRDYATDLINYDELMELLSKAKGNSKTTREMNQLIPIVYQSFGKNPGLNSNRTVKNVIKLLEGWHEEKERRVEKSKTYKDKVSKREAKAQKEREEDAKRRLPPSTRSTVHTIDSIGGGVVDNMDVRNTNKTDLIPQPKKKK